MNHAYPQQLATFVAEHWDDPLKEDSSDLPPLPLLETLISTCYQASLLRQEQVPVTFRAIFCSPEDLPEDGGPPTGLHRLIFTEPRPFSANELRNLSTGAPFHRAMIGVRLDDPKGPNIWGIVHSGPRWLRALHGGRGAAPALPAVPIITVTGPGMVEFLQGAITIGQLSDGQVYGPSMNVFQSRWLQDTFSDIRTERISQHHQHREQANTDWADLDPDLTRVIDQHLTKRIIAAMRAFHHGGTVIMVPPERTAELCTENPYLSIRYQFNDEEPRARFRSLIVAVMDRLAEIGARSKIDGESKMVGWLDYEESSDPVVAALDEAIFEMSHLIAGLSTVDGAVVLTKRFELLGFGAEIRCDLAESLIVARALDLEGERHKLEHTQNRGTRHSSAYRLCHQLKDSVAIIVSQDGGVRFVRWLGSNVTYWDHRATFTFSSRY